jgi:hypothetical protein
MSPLMDKFVVVQLEKDEMKVLRWVMLARAKDEARPTLMGVLVKADEWVACNGYAIHLARLVKVNNPLPEGNWLVRSIQKDMVILEKNDSATIYLDYKKIMNVGFKGTIVQSKGWKALIDIQPWLMKDALAMPVKAMRMTVGNGPILFEGKEAGINYELIGVIMPMMIDSSSGITFVPQIDLEPNAGQPA